MWALISRPDRGRPTCVWLVDPRRTVTIRGGGAMGSRYEVHRPAATPLRALDRSRGRRCQRREAPLPSSPLDRDAHAVTGLHCILTAPTLLLHRPSLP
jgi:hypothetical protein